MDTLQPQSRAEILWSFAKPHTGTLIIALLLGFVASGMDLASPMATRWVLEVLESGGSLAGPVWTLIALLVLSTLIGWWQFVLLGTLAEQIVFDARKSMIRRFIRSKVLPVLQRPTGELITRVTSDSVLLREAASSSMIGIINGVVMLVGTIVLMGVLNLTLTLTTIIGVALVVAIFTLLTPAIAQAEEASQEALGKLGAELEGNLHAIKTVKVAAAEQRQLTVLIEFAEASRLLSTKAVRRQGLVWTVGWAGVQAVTIIVLGFGAWQVAQGEMTVATLVAFLLYTFGLMAPIGELSSNISTLQSGMAAAGRIKELENLELESIQHSTANPAPDDTAPMIELDRVTARYDAATPAAITDVSLQVPRSGHLAIVGPSGAGKTTILSLMLGFIEPENGQLRLAGIPYSELGVAKVRESFAYVEQETPILPGTLRDNLIFSNQTATEEQIMAVLSRIKLDELVANLPDGLDTPIRDSSISGGQRQRIALARAILAEPAVLLLDEATAQVDGLSEAAIHEVIRQQAQTGTVVTIAHRLSTVVDADTIVVMDNAHIVAHGNHEELLATSELYRDLVAALEISSE